MIGSTIVQLRCKIAGLTKYRTLSFYIVDLESMRLYPGLINEDSDDANK